MCELNWIISPQRDTDNNSGEPITQTRSSATAKKARIFSNIAPSYCAKGISTSWTVYALITSVTDRQTDPLSSDRQRLSYGDCLEVRGEIIRTVLCCVVYWKLCIVISTLRWAVLTVLWSGFCLTGPISLCVDSCVHVFVALYCHTAYVLYYCNTVGWTWWDWSLILEHLPSVLWHCWLGHLIRKTRPRYDL